MWILPVYELSFVADLFILNSIEFWSGSNPALAQAGSGDLLAGIIAGILTMTRDIYTAVCMGVWLHGHLADLALEKQSMQTLSLESYPELMDELFRKHGY